MKKIFLSLLPLVALAACSDPVTATRVAEGQGYTHVEITGYRVFGCSKHDNVRTGFTARGINGAPVSGVVCSQIGPFGKSSTLRVD